MAISATSIFGNGNASSIFASGVSAGATPAQQAAQVVVDASNRQIKQIRGYKTQLTPADNKRLNEIQQEIVKINQKASDGTVRQDELEDRSELYVEADFIIGKPAAGIENDDFLDDINEKIADLLTRRLTPQQENRLDTLNNLKANYEAQLEEESGNVNAIRQIQNITYQINQIDVPRQVSELSVSEKSQYDDLVEQANDYAGVKLLLNATESIRVQHLQETIDSMAGSLPADPASQPTASAVARAYTRFA